METGEVMETGECCCDSYYGFAADVSSTKIRKARKPHTCCECGDTIGPGQRYEVASGCWEGSWDHFKTCITCVRIRDDLFPCGHVYTGLREMVRYCYKVDL